MLTAGPGGSAGGSAGGGVAEFDLAIIGGGIHGTGVARDAAGRGLEVLLVEQGDLAAGATAASSKLIHGDIGDLVRGDYRQVRAALVEREVMMRIAPHLVRETRLVLPGPDGERPAWRRRADLFLYDHLARRRMLPPTRTLDLTHHACGAPLRRRFTAGFEFSDCRVDDARLCVLNAVDAASRGALVRTRTKLIRAERGEAWTLVLNARGRRLVATARAVVNATGGFVGIVNETMFRLEPKPPVRLVKGSHVVVKSLFDHGCGYALPMPGGRFVFALPFADAFTLVGTTDEIYAGDPAMPLPDMAEILYLCEAINLYFRENITSHDVVWSFSGVRSLSRAPATSSEVGGAVLACDEAAGQAPLMTIYGGSITTSRRICEAALGRLDHFFAARPAWTGKIPLPGGDFSSLAALLAEMRKRWRFLDDAYAARLAGAYGRRAELILGEVRAFEDLGEHFGGGLTAAEVRYLMRHEFAETADDVLWRRSKLGLRLDADQRERLARFMAARLGAG